METGLPKASEAQSLQSQSIGLILSGPFRDVGDFSGLGASLPCLATGTADLSLQQPTRWKSGKHDIKFGYAVPPHHPASSTTLWVR